MKILFACTANAGSNNLGKNGVCLKFFVLNHLKMTNRWIETETVR